MTTNKNYFCIVIKSLIDSIIVYRRKQNNCDKYEMLARNFSNGNINWNEMHFSNLHTPVYYN